MQMHVHRGERGTYAVHFAFRTVFYLIVLTADGGDAADESCGGKEESELHFWRCGASG